RPQAHGRRRLSPRGARPRGGPPPVTDRTIAPPHPDPHPPTAFTPPPGATDAHCHIFGPGDRFPYAPDRAYTPPDSGIDDFEALQSRLGLSHAVFVQASCHGTDNSAMLDALRRGQ